MKLLRTPDERFENLEGYAFAPHYTEIVDADDTRIRIHHVDEGPRGAAPILLMHGNPTWAYLYRKMIPPLARAGHRVVAVDLVGCGRSDKPAERADYTQARHVDWLEKWLCAVDLSGITLFCQDWGGTLGLHLVAGHPERFARVVVANSGLPLGEGETGFMKTWIEMMRNAERFPFQPMLPGGMTHALRPGELAAYLAPYPDPAYEAALCSFPGLIAAQPGNPGVAANRAAWARLGRFEKPFLTLFGAKDPITRGGEKALIAHVPGAAGQPHHVFPDASHFIQEDEPDALVERVLQFIRST
ncbi:MAG: haloalkane dehalogenase [Myxococcota bacterium]